MPTTGCSNDTPPITEDCADPAYRAAHPDECRNFQQLILIPQHALLEAGETRQFTVLLRANGVETEITLGLTWFTSNLGAVMINANGLASAVAAGQSTVSVEWQNLSAHAQVDVVANCDDTHQNFLVLVDNSASMGQSFSSGYATKLAFSKYTAREFANTINYTKDQIAVSKFNDDYSLLSDFIDSSTAARAVLNGVTLSTGKTNLADALEQAIAEFEGQEGVRVIVLFTDGEWSGDDPKPIARAFKESGGFIVVVATRAWGTYFVDLLEIASGGFLISAHEATEEQVLTTLNGLKSFICSGSCNPEPGTAPTAQLNYNDFINWDVTAGLVDLCGLGIYDIQPGNGLYVDLQGTGAAGVAHPGEDIGLGQLTSKNDYDFVDGNDYSFEISVGGSLSHAAAGEWTIRIRVGDDLDEEVTITNGNTPLTPYLFEWTATSNHTGPIIIEQTVQSGHFNIGTLIDEITLRDETTLDEEAAVLLYDNFDLENPVTVPPNPSLYGCLQTSPGSQAADPTPPSPRLVE